jgi:hypothetical protein
VLLWLTAYTCRQRYKNEPNNFGDDSLSSIFQSQKQLGAGLVAIGLLLSFLGVMLLFERNLLRLGNISLIFGIALLIGPSHVLAFFLQESRLQASVITAIGVALVFSGRPRIGILLEIFGLLNLFGYVILSRSSFFVTELFRSLRQ